MNRKNLQAFLQAFLKASEAGTVSEMDVEFLKGQFWAGYTSFRPRPFVDEYGRKGVVIEAVYPIPPEKQKLYGPRTEVERLFFLPEAGMMLPCTPGEPRIG